MASVWPKILTDRIRSKEWSELPLSAQALFPVYCICAGPTGASWYDKAKLLAITGLSLRGFQEANRELVRRGWIRRDWDGNFTHAAITTILPPTPKTSAPDALGVAQQNVGGSAPDAGGVAQQMPQTSAPDAPQDITRSTTEKHNTKQGGKAAGGVVCEFLVSRGVWPAEAHARAAEGVTLAQAERVHRAVLNDRAVPQSREARAKALNYRLKQGAGRDDPPTPPTPKPATPRQEILPPLPSNPPMPSAAEERARYDAGLNAAKEKQQAEEETAGDVPEWNAAGIPDPTQPNKVKAAAVLKVLGGATSDAAGLAAYRQATQEGVV